MSSKVLFSLRDISYATGISMPTLTKYVKSDLVIAKDTYGREYLRGKLAKHAVFRGRRPMFLPSAFDVFRSLKTEGLAQRGKRRKGQRTNSD